MGELTKMYRIPGLKQPREVPWEVFRKETGLCETCDQQMSSHDECETCHILCGVGHTEGKPLRFRGHKLCNYCIQAWRKVELILGRSVEFEEFRGGIPPSGLPVMPSAIVRSEGEE